MKANHFVVGPVTVLAAVALITASRQAHALVLMQSLNHHIDENVYNTLEFTLNYDAGNFTFYWDGSGSALSWYPNGDGNGHAPGFIDAWVDYESTGANVTPGTVLSPSMTWYSYSDFNATPSSTAQHVGFRINQGGGNYLYGWASYTTVGFGDSFEVLEVAINTTPNASITVVPEPGACLTISATACMGFALLRRNRRD